MQRTISILLLVFPLIVIGLAEAHDDPEANHDGGPCWIWELTTYPLYCIFVKGTAHEHPRPDVPPIGEIVD